jgi:putative endonuclease
MRRATKPLGDIGEGLAVRRLAELGYRVLETNYHCPLGELDCVAVKDRTLVFLEVKTRTSNVFGGPLEAVDRRKRRKLTRLAQYYLSEKRLHGVPQRFDVVAIWVGQGGARVEVFENAFDAEE